MSWTSFDTDDQDQFEQIIRCARQAITSAAVPCRPITLNEGRYILGVNASSYRIRRYFQDEQALSFTVEATDAPGSQWPEARLGPVRPRLAWQIEAEAQIKSALTAGERRTVMNGKRTVKKVLGKLPFTAEMYWRYVQQGRPLAKNFSLRKLENSLPEWCAQARAAQASRLEVDPGRRIVIFATLRYWIEHAALLSVALAGLGHRLPWPTCPMPTCAVRMSASISAARMPMPAACCRQAHPQSRPSPCWMSARLLAGLFSGELFHALQQVSLRDTQYTLQIEEVDLGGA